MTTRAPKVNEDLDAIESPPEVLTLTNGQEIEVSRLKTREVLKLFRILTRGVGPMLADLDFRSMQDDTQQFAGQLLALVVMAIPEAEDETIEFISAVTKPKLIDSPKSKADQQKNIDAIESLALLLRNPEIEDTITIVSNVVTNEAPEIQRLGKQLGAIMKTMSPARQS